MNLQEQTCPRCMQMIAAERLIESPTICDSCGNVLGTNEHQVKRQFERRALAAVIGSALFVVLSFIHIVNWGGHSLEVLPLLAGEWIGFDSLAGHERKAEICADVKNLDCVEHMFALVAMVQPEKLQRLGRLQMQRAKFAEAAESFRQLFASGAQDLDAAFMYARALAEVGRIDDASKYFEYVLRAKPDVIQITVVQAYVKMLATHRRFDEALKVIDQVRKRDDSKANFMDSEYKVIQERKAAGSHS